MSERAAQNPQSTFANRLVLNGMVTLYVPSMEMVSIWNWGGWVLKYGCQNRLSHQWTLYWKSVKQLGTECLSVPDWSECSQIFGSFGALQKLRDFGVEESVQFFEIEEGDR